MFIGLKIKNWEYILLILYIFWGWTFSYTIFAHSIFIYASFISLLCAFFVKSMILMYQRVTFSQIVLIWFPFYFYVAFSYFNASLIENFTYWLIGYMIILNAKNDSIISRLPYKIILYGGLFMAFGILLQMLFPDIYLNTARKYIVYEAIDSWTETSFGFNGFAYQLGVAAQILLAAELVIIFLRGKVLSVLNNNIVYFLFITVIIVCIFLTGKRMNSLIAIAIPSIVYFVRQKNFLAQLVFIAFLGFVFYLLVLYIQDNAEMLLDSPLTKRFTKSIVEASEGESYLSGRDYLWHQAMILFKEYPLLGAGPIFSSIYGVDVHNAYIQCLCEQGLIGFLLYILPLLFCLLVTIKLCRTSPKNFSYYPYLLYSFACQLNYILEGFTDNTNINRNGFLMYSIAIAILIEYKSLIYKQSK